MSKTACYIYLHFVWATRDRLPLLTPERERRVHRMIESVVEQQGATALAIGGMPDHVHLLVATPATCAPSDLMQSTKGASSAFARRLAEPDGIFSWQHGFGVFSIAQNQIPLVVRYIQRQKERHAENQLWATLEEMPTPPERSEAAHRAL